VVDLLIFVEAIVEVGLARRTEPQKVPVMRLSILKIHSLKRRPDSFDFTLE